MKKKKNCGTCPQTGGGEGFTWMFYVKYDCLYDFFSLSKSYVLDHLNLLISIFNKFKK